MGSSGINKAYMGSHDSVFVSIVLFLYISFFVQSFSLLDISRYTLLNVCFFKMLFVKVLGSLASRTAKEGPSVREPQTTPSSPCSSLTPCTLTYCGGLGIRSGSWNGSTACAKWALLELLYTSSASSPPSSGEPLL